MVSLFGGIPINGVIARSTLNIRAGAQTRRSSVFHAFYVILALVLFPGFLSQIPVAALSGVLLSIAIGMIRPKEVVRIWRTSPVETIIYWVTLFTVIAVDLMAGVQLGIFAALLIALWNLGQARLFFHKSDSEEILRVSFTGNLTFMASRNMELLSKRVSRLPKIKSLIIDMADVQLVDSSGATMLVELIRDMKTRGVRILIKSLNREGREVLSVVDVEGVAKEYHVASESEITAQIKDKKAYSPKDRLLFGIQKYREERKEAYEELFDQLGQQQKPHTLFITCSDSRINPSLITSSEPGELFIVRNVGNIVPPLGADDTPAEGAAIEFSIGALGVEEIIICGHTRCGAIKGAFQGIDPLKFPSVTKWVEPIAKERTKYPDISDPEDFVKIHVLEQAKNILSYPIVRKSIKEGQMRVHCWIYDVVEGEFLEWTGKGLEYVPVGPQSLHGNIQALLSPSQTDY
jgi:carbonic anhydrase